MISKHFATASKMGKKIFYFCDFFLQNPFLRGAVRENYFCFFFAFWGLGLIHFVATARDRAYIPSKNYPRQTLPIKYYPEKSYHKLKVVYLIGPLFHCRPLFVIHPSFVMDYHVVPAIVVDAYRIRPGVLAPRHNWNDEYIKTVTDWAWQHRVPVTCLPRLGCMG